MDIDKEIRNYIISLAANANVYYPMDIPLFYCPVDEYEQNKHKVKLHYPVIHRYFNAGWCINTDGIGMPFNVRHLSYQDPEPGEYPEELIQKVDFPLYIGAGDYWDTERGGFWRNGFGDFVWEKFIISFSLTRKTTHFYRIYVRLNDKKISFEAEKLLLPPYIVVISDRAWWGEEDSTYTLKDLENDLINAIMEFKPSFSAYEIEHGAEKEYEKRREKIISLIREEMIENE